MLIFAFLEITNFTLQKKKVNLRYQKLNLFLS